MTKRMLSLLLALVMTLSLCVPALAADDFAAEAVTETGEQAPDTPAAAAVTEDAEDAPEAVYFVDVESDTKTALDAAIKAAASDAAAVKAHTKMTEAEAIGSAEEGLLAQFIGEETDPFLAAYNELVKYQRDIANKTGNVDDATVKSAISDLTEKQEKLTATTTIQLDKDAIKGVLGTADETGRVFIKDFDGTYDWFYATTQTGHATNLAKLKLILQADFVDDFMAAVGKAEDYNDSTDEGEKAVSVKSLYDALTALYAVRVAGDDYKAALTPGKSEAAELKALIDSVKNKLKDKQYVTVDPEGANQVDTLSSWTGKATGTKTQSVNTVLNTANGLFKNGLSSSGFGPNVTYWGYSRSKYELEAAEKLFKVSSTLVSFDSYAVQAGGETVDLYLVLDNSDETKADAHTYVVTYQVNGGNETLMKSSGSVKTMNSAAIAEATAGDNVFKFDTYTNQKDGANAKLKKSDVIVFRLYTYDKGVKGDMVDDITLSKYDETYDGPLFRGTPTYNTSGTDQYDITGYLTQNVTGGDAKVLLVVDADTTVEDASSIEQNKYNLDKDKFGEKITEAGEYTLQLQNKVGGKDHIVSETTVEIPALTKWQNKTPISAPRKMTVANVKDMAAKIGGINDLETFIKAVKDLDDNIVQAKKNTPAHETTESLKALLADAVTAAEKFVTDAETLAYTQANIDKVYKAASGTGVANTIETLLSYLTEGADMTELNKALATAKTLKETDYTADSWIYADLANVIEKVEKALKENIYTSADQDTVDGLVDDLNDAMAILEPVGADKAALNAAIADAAALKAEDYTEESWKAADLAAAIAAAKAVADKANASATEINAAIAALKAATDKLVKKDEEQKPSETHPAPTTNNGTGWSRDTATGEWYFYKNGKLVANYWVGQTDGASKWATNWYYVGADGKQLTGMQYVDDLHGGKAWYFLQPTNDNGEIGKMLTGWQWVGGEYGTCYFSSKNGESGKCTYSTELGDWNGTTWVPQK